VRRHRYHRAFRKSEQLRSMAILYCLGKAESPSLDIPAPSAGQQNCRYIKYHHALSLPQSSAPQRSVAEKRCRPATFTLKLQTGSARGVMLTRPRYITYVRPRFRKVLSTCTTLGPHPGGQRSDGFPGFTLMCPAHDGACITTQTLARATNRVRANRLTASSLL
jgi:hypothetical protein